MADGADEKTIAVKDNDEANYEAGYEWGGDWGGECRGKLLVWRMNTNWCPEDVLELIVSFHPRASGATYSATASCKANASGLPSTGRPARKAYHGHRQYRVQHLFLFR